MLVSECCGMPPHKYYDCLCSECGEHTDFYDDEEEEQEEENETGEKN